MIKKLYSVKDVKSGLFNAPMMFVTKGEAIRGFTQAANDNGTMVGKYPEDFGLYELGEFNDESAKITVYDTPYHLGNASDFVRKPE